MNLLANNVEQGNIILLQLLLCQKLLGSDDLSRDRSLGIHTSTSRNDGLGIIRVYFVGVERRYSVDMTGNQQIGIADFSRIGQNVETRAVVVDLLSLDGPVVIFEIFG